MRRSLALLLVLAGCPGARAPERPPLADSVAGNDGNVIAAMIAELQDDVLLSYERDEPPELESGIIPAEIGSARIGVGPGDVLIAGELERAPSRWPLRVDKDMPTEVRSKRLETHLAQDLSAAWVFDELSWRISMCGRTAVIPLRITMLYARDGDRWVPVFEHMSFGHTPAPRRDGALYGKTIASKVPSADFKDELSNVVNPVLSHGPNRTAALATGPEAMLLGPDSDAEWHGLEVLDAQLAPGPARIVEDRRIGYLGRSLGKSTIAYWIGNVIADLPARPGVAAGKVRMRTTFVFEHRRVVKVAPNAKGEAARPELKSCAADPKDCTWVLVQGHVSQPIGDQELATKVFGTALLSSNLESGESLRLTCDDGSSGIVRVPGAALPKRPAPAAHNP